tara:strand:- start:6522 stop:8207 length:1686 start_codon:yes stop_codon:yes gene_type:complete
MILINLCTDENNKIDKNMINNINKFKNYVKNDKNIKSCENYKKTLHEYEYDLPVDLKKIFSNIKNNKKILDKVNELYPNHDIINANKMNELYVSCVSSTGSDKVFVTKHVDGPYYLFPGCNLLRVLFVIDGNKNVYTIFPEDNKEISLEKCEMMGFDYNRDIHYIQRRNNVDDNTIRIVLKIHYVVVPKYMSFLSSLCKVCNEKYNEVARDNFNKSKTPDSLTEKAISLLINSTTKAYSLFLENVGWENLFILLIWYKFMKNDLKGSSLYFCQIYFFIYYFAWIFRKVKLDHFIRDAVIFKNISWIIILKLYFDEKTDNSSLIVSTIGLIIVYTAYLSLGKKVTFFQKELTNKETKLVLDKFPYNLGIKSPMIVGNIIFLSGLLINNDFRRNSKNLIILQISGYLVQMFLEDKNIHLENDYNKIKNEFSLYHKKNGNIRAHLITTIIGFIALVGYIGNLSESPEILKCFILTIIHILNRYTLPEHQLFLNNCILFLTYFVTKTKKFNYISILILSVILQELSHYVYKEKTYISSYNEYSKLILHNIWLVPLVINSYFEIKT